MIIWQSMKLLCERETLVVHCLLESSVFILRISYLLKMTINLWVPYEKNVRARYSILCFLDGEKCASLYGFFPP
jgi:hypothetical protein